MLPYIRPAMDLLFALYRRRFWEISGELLGAFYEESCKIWNGEVREQC
jgi:hypothetical protein